MLTRPIQPEVFAAFCGEHRRQLLCNRISAQECNDHAPVVLHHASSLSPVRSEGGELLDDLSAAFALDDDHYAYVTGEFPTLARRRLAQVIRTPLGCLDAP